MDLDADAIFDSFVEVIHQIANGLPPNFYCETLANLVPTVSTTEELLQAMRDPNKPFKITKMSAVTLNACPRGRFASFSEALKSNNSVVALTVILEDSETRLLADALKGNRTLQKIDLTVRYLDADCMLTGDTCQILSDTLFMNETIKKINLTIRANCSVILDSLNIGFRRPNHIQVTLIIEDKMQKNEFERLIETLKSTNITCLKLGYYFSSAYNGINARQQFSTDGMKLLCDYITKSNSLKLLKLCTPLNIEQVKDLTEAISSSRSITTFYYESRTTSETYKLLVEAVSHNINIRKFLIYDWRHNQSNFDVNGYLLNDLLESNFNLESLSLLNINVKEPWKIIFGAQLEKNSALRRLIISRAVGTKKKAALNVESKSLSKDQEIEYEAMIDQLYMNNSLTKLIIDGSSLNIREKEILKRNKQAQNTVVIDTIVILFNIARTNVLPIDIWAHIFNKIRYPGVNPDFGHILLNIYSHPVARRVI